jgi:alpha-glucosidase (family GH31 glycosyl hydrolase)
MAVSDDGNAVGGFLKNSNAMSATVADTSLQMRTIGGMIDYFLFVGGTPADVVKQYHAIIGNPVLVPYWSLGWH